MRYTPHILGLAVLLGAATGAWAKPAYVSSTVNLRAAPGTTSEILGKIPGGSLIDAENCAEGWCAVTWKDKHGFAVQSALDMSGQVPQQRRAARPPAYVAQPGYQPGYVVEGPPVYYQPAPTYYYGYRPYYRPYWGYRRYGW